MVEENVNVSNLKLECLWWMLSCAPSNFSGKKGLLSQVPGVTQQAAFSWSLSKRRTPAWGRLHPIHPITNWCRGYLSFRDSYRVVWDLFLDCIEGQLLHFPSPTSSSFFPWVLIDRACTWASVWKIKFPEVLIAYLISNILLVKWCGTFLYLPYKVTTFYMLQLQLQSRGTIPVRALWLLEAAYFIPGNCCKPYTRRHKKFLV